MAPPLSRDSVITLVAAAAGVAAVVIELNWAARGFLVLLTIGFIGYVVFHHQAHILWRLTIGLGFIACLIFFSWRPIWEDFHRAYPDMKIEPVHLTISGLSGVLLCAALALAGTIWQIRRPVPAAAPEKPVASSPIWPSSPYVYTHVRIQFKGNGLPPLQIDESNVYRWFALGSMLLSVVNPQQTKLAGWTIYMTFDRPIIFTQFKIDGLGDMRYEVKSWSQRHAIIAIFGDPPPSVVDIIAAE